MLPATEVTSQTAFAQSRVEKVKDEFQGMADFCKRSNMRGTFLFFGSARALSQAAYDAEQSKANAVIADASASEDAKAKAQMTIAKLQSQSWAPAYWEKTRELARLLTEWGKSDDGVKVGNLVNTNFPEANGAQPLIVCTGGGPGFMEAGNKGAAEAQGASMGVGIVLPFETLNDYVTPELGYTCDTFYARKYWEVFCAKAMIVSPGGVGSSDEMFEVLTLMQCRKMPKIPVVLLGKEFWTTAINFRYLADRGMMSHAEIDELCITDDPKEAHEFIANALRREAEANASK